MFDQEITLNRFMLDYCDRLMVDLGEDEFLSQAAGGGHSPQWILAHLTVVADYAGLMIGMKPAAPKAMREAFGPGSAESPREDVDFSRSALAAGLRPAYERLYESLDSADVDSLSGPHGVDLLAGTAIVTKADLVAHILTTHIATHVGQLSALRRSLGRAPLF